MALCPVLCVEKILMDEFLDHYFPFKGRYLYNNGKCNKASFNQHCACMCVCERVHACAHAHTCV